MVFLFLGDKFLSLLCLLMEQRQYFCSFLKKEWSYLNQEEASLCYPLVDNIWKNLPCRIDEINLTVCLLLDVPKFF